MARHALARGAFLIAVILWLLPGCTLVSTIPSKAPKHAYLRVIAKPSSATLFLNDKSIGSARVLKKRPQRAQPGTHRLRIEAPHYFPHDLILDLPRGETVLRVSLRPIPR